MNYIEAQEVCHAGAQRLCVYLCFVAIFFFVVAFLLAGFLPPPRPTLTAAEVAAHYQQHTSGIRLGMMIMVFSGALTCPLVALISIQLRRIEGATPIWAYTQLVAGTVGILFFVLPGLIFTSVAFLPERSQEITLSLHHLGWIMAVMPGAPAFVQNVVTGLAILSDKSPNPVFPRWLGYFNLWVPMLIIPGSLVGFFKTGPFAWNGLISFWVGLTVFGIWFIVMGIMLLKAVDKQVKEIAAQEGNQ